MASSIASLAVDVSANIARLRSDFQQANKVTSQQFSQMRKSVEGSLAAMEARARNTGRAVLASLGAIGTIEIAKRLAHVADGYQNVQAKIRLVTNTQEDFVRTSQQALDIAQKTFTSYDSVASLVGRTTRAMEGLGHSNEIAIATSLALSNTIAKGLAIGGSTAQESSASIIQLTQALASNKLAGDEFRSFMENAPRLAVGLSHSLGVSIGELRKLSLEGKLTTDIVVKGLLAQAAAIEEEFKQVPLTVGRAWQIMSNDFMVYIGQGAEATGITKALANSLIFLGKNLETIGKIFASGFLLYANRQMAAAVAGVINWIRQTQMAAAWSQASAINAAKDAAAQLEVARATAASTAAKVASARASHAQLLATQAVIVTAREEQIAKLSSLGLEEAKIAATIASARAAGAQSFAIAILAEAEVNLARVQAARMAVVAELAALGVANTRSMQAQTASAASLAAAEVALAEAQAGAAAAATAAATAQTAAARASGGAATGIAKLGSGLLAFVGGPVGLTIAGVAALGYALYALADAEESASKKADELIAQFDKAAAAARNFSVDPVKMINLSTDEVLGELKDDLKAAEAELSQLTEKLGGATGRMVDMYAGQAAMAQAEVDKLRQKINDLAVSSAMAAEAERERARAMKEGLDLGAEARDLLEQQASSTDKAAKSVGDFAAKTNELIISMMGPGAQAWAQYLHSMAEASAEAAKAGATADELRERQEVLWAQYQETNEEIKSQQDFMGKLAKNTKYEQSLIRMTDRQRAFAEAYEDAMQEFESNKKAFAEAGVSAQQYATAMGDAAVETFDMVSDAEALADALSGLNEKTELEDLADKIAIVGKELAKAIGANALDDVVRLTLAMEKLQGKVRANFVKSFERSADASAQALASIQTMYAQGSRAYEGLALAIDAANIAAGIAAIVNQGMGDPYTAIPRMIAMAAMVGKLVKGIGSFASGGFSNTAAKRQSSQGTGSVLGEPDEDTKSIANGVEITANATSELVGINRGMLRALLTLQAGIGGAAVQLARGVDGADFSGLDLAASSSFIETSRMLHDSGGLFDFAGIFQSRSKITDEGIIIFGGELNELLQDIAVGAYQEVQSRTWAFGSTHTNEGVVPVSDEFETQFQLVINSIADTVREGAIALGMLPADVEAAIAAFHVEEIRISLKDLTPEEQQAELEAVFGELFDGLAGEVVPFIAQFQQLGEGLGETLVRVATEVQVMREAIRFLGLSVEESDPEKFAQISDSLINMTGGIEEFINQMNSFASNFAPEHQKLAAASSALVAAFSEANLTIPATEEGMWDLMQSLDATTEEGREQIATLLRLSDVAAEYYDMLEQHAEEYQEMLEAVSPGLSEFSQAIHDIIEQEQEYISIANQHAAVTGQYGRAERDLVAIHRWAVEQTRAAIEALRSSTMDLISQLYGGMPGSLEEINRRIAAEEARFNSELGHIGDVAAASKQRYEQELQALMRLQEFVDGLLLGDLSTLTPGEQLAEAQSQYMQTLIAAQGGDLEALEALPGIAQTYLEIAQGYYSTTDGFTQISDSVMAALNALLSAGPQTLPGIGTGGSGGGHGGSAELDSLYAQREALQAQEDAANRLALATQLAQQLGDLATALNIPLFAMAEQMGVSIALLVADLGINLDELTETTGTQLASVAAMLGVGLPELAAELGISMASLVEAMGLDLSDLGSITGAALLSVATELGMTVLQLVESLDLNMVTLVESMGVSLADFSVETAIALAELAGQMGISLAELAEAVGEDVGLLIDSQSILNDALEDTIGTLPEGIRGNLQDLFDDIAEATTEADANAAVQALQDATMELPEEYRDLLAPFFDSIDPTEQLNDLAYLQLLSEAADWQTDLLTGIKGYAGQIAANTGSTGSSATSAHTAAGGESSAASAAHVVYGPTGDEGYAATIVSAINGLRAAIDEANEENQIMMMNRLMALEEAIGDGAAKTSAAVVKATAERRGY